MNSIQIGNLTELKLITRLVELGKEILFPYGSERYDFIFRDDKKYKRVQCKTGRIKKNAIEFKVAQWNRKGESTSYLGWAEYFGVYCPDNKKCYLIPIEDIDSQRMCSLRLKLSYYRNQRKFRMAKDYEL